MESSSPILNCLQNASSRDQDAGNGRFNDVNTADGGGSDEIQAKRTGGSAEQRSSSPAHSVGRARAPQVVLTLETKAMIFRWMTEDAEKNGEHRVQSRTVRHFPQFFRQTEKANLARAKRYWRQRAFLMSGHDKVMKGSDIAFTRRTSSGVHRHNFKACSGRGRKKPEWTVALYVDLLSEFERYRKLGVKFNMNLLQTLAKKVIQESDNPAYGPTSTDTKGDLIIDKVKKRWIQSFMQSTGIISRCSSGKPSVSPEKTTEIERSVATFLGQISREFSYGTLKEKDVANSDETYFTVNMSNASTLALLGDREVRFADVVSGDIGMTMMVTLTGGRDAALHPAFLIFTKENRSYPIRGVEDNIPGVSYRTAPKGFMDRAVMPLWLGERRAIWKLGNNRQRTLFMDNCASHALTDDVNKVLGEINTKIRFLPKNATHLIKPADSFVIQKIKCVWRRLWDEKRLELISNGAWRNGENGSGRLANPGKQFFLKVAAEAVREVNLGRDSDGVSYVRKAMVRCGLSLNFNGLCETKQLFSHLQEIIKKYPEDFVGGVEST